MGCLGRSTATTFDRAQFANFDRLAALASDPDANLPAMRMWPISTRVNKPENDDPSIVEPIALAASAA